jgi:predicted DNA-binding protein YlxM (UPF0122 family)
MISELTFSKKFTSFWKQALPNGNEFVRMVNLGLKEVITEPLPEPKRNNNTVLINVTSNAIFDDFVSDILKLSTISSSTFISSDEIYQYIDKSISYLNRFSYGTKLKLPLDDIERKEIIDLFNILYRMYVKDVKNIEVAPKFPGCGFISPAKGDLFCNGKLIEIKSGKRNFSIYDFRQIIIYCTLNYMSKHKYKIDRIELFNPRMGVVYSSSIEGLCRNLSARSDSELFEEIGQYLTNTEFAKENEI